MQEMKALCENLKLFSALKTELALNYTRYTYANMYTCTHTYLLHSLDP
jgi:hypothetical protein